MSLYPSMFNSLLLLAAVAAPATAGLLDVVVLVVRQRVQRHTELP